MSRMGTVGAYAEEGRRIVWRCQGCRAEGEVDLAAIIAASGPDVVLANRRPPCRHCPGRVLFEDRSSMWPRKLDTFEDWDFDDRMRRDMKAAGWRIEMGCWYPPDPHQS